MKDNERLLDVIGEVDDDLIPDLSGIVEDKEHSDYEKNNYSFEKIGRIIGILAAIAATITLVVLVKGIGNSKIGMSEDYSSSSSSSSSSESPASTDGVSPIEMHDLPPVPDLEGPFGQDGVLDGGTKNVEYTIATCADTDTTYLLATADYPKMVLYPDYVSMPKSPDGYNDGIDGYLNRTIRTFLSDSSSQNTIYSPICLYMALAMSAEITDGNSRRQILELLGQDDIDVLRRNAKAIWENNYLDDGLTKKVASSSVWLNSSLNYNNDTIRLLAENYYSSVFCGEPTDAGYENRMKKWLNEHTGNLLENYVSDIKMDPTMIVSLASTIDFFGKWKEEFPEKDTKEAVFHTPTGDVTCDFMNDISYNYQSLENFSSVSFWMEGGCKMVTLLPNEGVSCEDLLNDEEALTFIMGNTGPGDEPIKAYVSIPKFDVSSGTDLSEGLKELGITDIFDSSVSDFSPLTDGKNITIGSTEHDARIMIDEEGCRASAMTVIPAYPAYENDDEPVYYTLDRPFIFSIVGTSGIPLFVGIVNNPIG